MKTPRVPLFIREDKAVVEALDALARREGTDRNKLIRRLIRAHLAASNVPALRTFPEDGTARSDEAA